MGIFLLWTTWAHEYMAMFFNEQASHAGAFKKSWRYVMLTKLGQHVNRMM